MFLGFNTRPILIERGTSVQKLTYLLTVHVRTRCEKQYQVVHSDQTIWEENFYMVDHAPCHGQFLIEMLTCDLLLCVIYFLHSFRHLLLISG